jgi:hypothetical protein
MRVNRYRLIDLATGVGCKLQVAGRALCKCCLYLLLATNLSILRPCSANALLTQTVFIVCSCSCVILYLRFLLLRCNPKLYNPNSKHYNYVYNLNANPSNSAGQRTK